VTVSHSKRLRRSQGAAVHQHSRQAEVLAYQGHCRRRGVQPKGSQTTTPFGTEEKNPKMTRLKGIYCRYGVAARYSPTHQIALTTHWKLQYFFAVSGAKQGMILGKGHSYWRQNLLIDDSAAGSGFYAIPLKQ